MSTTTPNTTPTIIRRDLFTKNPVHIYPTPPLKSISSGYRAADWGVDRESSRIFTARLRVVETTTILPTKPSSSTTPDDEEEERQIRTDIHLEDPSTSELFANCPYTNAHCVEPVLDSSRFFAICVVDGNRKAYLGIGFEDRGAAFDFGVCLQEIRRHNGLDAPKPGQGKNKQAQLQSSDPTQAQKQDYSLKEGETIKIIIGNKGRRKPPPSSPPATATYPTNPTSPTQSPLPFLPPPPSAEQEKRRRRESYKQNTTADFSGWATSAGDDWGAFETTPTTSIKEGESEDGKGKGERMGFDDDPFGDFV